MAGLNTIPKQDSFHPARAKVPKGRSRQSHLKPMFHLMCLLLTAMGTQTFAGDVLIKIDADDLLRFKVNNRGTATSVKSGDKVRVEIKNVGRLKSHGHLLVLLKPGTDPGLFANVEEVKSGTLPDQLHDKVIAFSTLAGPGQTVSMSFTAPVPGRYTFLCAYPGHLRSKATLDVR